MRVPEYTEFIEVAEEIYELSVRKSALTLKLDEARSNIVRTCRNNVDYYLNGKAPSMDYVENAYLKTGFNGELIPVITELATVSASLEKLKLEYKAMEMAVAVWQTDSANKRAGSV